MGRMGVESVKTNIIQSNRFQQYLQMRTLRETNSSRLKMDGLEDGMAHFQVRTVSSREFKEIAPHHFQSRAR